MGADMKTKAILFAAYGIAEDETRENTIGKLVNTAASRYPDYDIRVAFTSELMIRKVTKKGIDIKNVSDTLKGLAEDGVKEVVLQPLHIIYSSEYERMDQTAKEFCSSFEWIKLGKPLLADTADYMRICELLNRVYHAEDEDCLVLMGHGTTHYGNSSYAALAYTLRQRNYKNIFIGALEAYPGIDVILKEVETYHPKKVRLAPFLFATAYHAEIDMAGGQESSWKSQIEKLGFPVEVILKGLADYAEFQEIFMDHLAETLQR